MILSILSIIDFVFKLKMNGDWGLGIGDWGLGLGHNPQSPKTTYIFS